MQIEAIEKMIRKAVRDEQRTGRMRGMLEEKARERGAELSQEALDGAVTWIREYIEHVPLLLRQGAAAAQAIGLGAEVGQVIEELERYWFEANDLIPDHLGLIGLTDDAYATLFLLQSLSDYCQTTFRRPLLQQSWTSVNQQMRTFIGEPVVSTLEQRVAVTLANAMMQRLLGGLTGGGFAFGATPDPIWGNASPEEIARVRLGAMGVV